MKGRRFVQIASALALNAGAWLQLKWLCPQIMWCHACPASVVSCPIGVLGYYVSFAIVPVFALGLLLVIGATIGRFLCGWVCPFGLVQDLLHKIPLRKRTLPRWTRYIKYVLLIVMVFFAAAFLGQDSLLYYCRTCPVATFSAILPKAISTGFLDTSDPVLMGRLIFLVVVLGACAVVSRFFCQVLCPVAALVAPCNEAAALAVRLREHECVSCGICQKVCPMDVDPMALQGAEASDYLTRTECISCTQCNDSCPKDALNLGV